MGRRLFLATIENGVSEAVSALAGLPVELHSVPVSRITPCQDAGELSRIAAGLNGFDWILFTSANAVAVFFSLLPAPAVEPFPRIACVGPNTAEHVKKLGRRVDFVSPEHTGDGFADAFARMHGAPPPAVLLPRPEKMGSDLVGRLTRAGVKVTECVIYRTEPLPPGQPPVPAFTHTDLFVFMSPSGARHFCRRHAIPAHAPVFAIGATTAGTIRELGCANVNVAEESSRDGLVDAIRRFLDNEHTNEEKT